MNQKTKNYLIMLTVFILSGLLFSIQPNASFANSVTESVYNEYNDYADRTITKEKVWTITFREKEPKSRNLSSNIYVATDENEKNKVKKVTVRISKNNPKVVTVSPPSREWTVGETYYLFVSKNLEFTNSTVPLPKTVRMKFTVVEHEVVDGLDKVNTRYIRSRNMDSDSEDEVLEIVNYHEPKGIVASFEV